MAAICSIVVSVVGIGFPYLVSGVTVQYRYLFGFGSFRDTLDQEVENLTRVHEHVKSRVEADQNNGRTIYSHVKKWLADVSAILPEADKLKEDMENMEGCFMGWACRYTFSKKFEEKTTKIIKLLETAQTYQEVCLPRAQFSIPYASCINFVPSQSSEVALNQIMECLKDENTNVIGLYGMGGVGKTTLVEQVIKLVDPAKLFESVVMVVVSQTPDLMAIQDKVAADLGLTFKNEKDKSTKAGLLESRMKGKKILIILDDIWDFINLPAIGIAFTEEQKSCKLLITTRNRNTCAQMSCNKEIPLDVMCVIEAWDLFKNRAALSDTSPIIDTAKEVAKECGGLPIAIVPLARALVRSTPNQWKAALLHLQNSNLLDITHLEDENAYKCLKMSYGQLDGEIKFCFLMCTLFPEDREINIEFLVRYAWGLGICQGADTIENTRTMVQSYIDDLKDYCLLITDSHTNGVKMHDVVRHFALWIAFNVEKDFTVGYISRKAVIRKSLETYSAISLIIEDTKDLPSGLLCGNLKLLLLRGKRGMSVSDTFFKQMEALQVLDLSNCSLALHLGNIPISIRVLSLEGCKVGDISSIGNLVKLEILSFAGSDIRELPDEIGEMKELKVLDLSDCRGLDRIPAGLIQKLLCLEELYVTGSYRTAWEVRGVDSGSSGKARLSEINSLSKLSVLFLKNIGECLLPDCFFLPNLTRYHFIEPNDSWYGYHDNPTSKILRMNKFNEISLNAYKIFFSTVEDLAMRENEEIRCFIPEMELGVFNNLISLHLSSWKKMVCLIDTTVENVPTMGFRNLKELEMYKMNSLKDLCRGQMSNEFLQKLERVIIVKCPKLWSLFKVQKEDIGNEDKLMLFSTLVELNLQELPELSCVWEGPTEHINLNRLANVRIDRCRKLKSIFSLSMARTLVHLQKLDIFRCNELEHIIEIEEEKEGPTRHIYLNRLTHVTITECRKLKSLFKVQEQELKNEDNLMLFSSLQWLFLKDLPELSCVWEGPTRHINLNRLTTVTIKKCGKLKSIFQVQEEEIGKEDNLMLFSTLQSLCLADLPELSCVWDGPTRHINLNCLTHVRIERCSKLKMFFKVHEEEIGKEDNLMLFSTLENLELIELPELSCVWEGPTRHINLNSLTYVTINECRKLKSIFSLSMARTLVHLEYLWIIDCDDLEHIIEEEEENGLQPSTIITNLIFTRLKSIYVDRNGALEQIFKYAEGNHMEMELSHLERIYIKGSPKLVNFSGGHCSSLSFPSLQTLTLAHCAIQFPPRLRLSGKKLKKVYLNKVPKEWGNYILSQLIIGGLPNLHTLWIGSLIGVEEVIRLEVDNQISDLVLPIKRLALEDLPQLVHICNCPSYTSILQNLTILYISSCHELSYIFSTTLAQNLPMLETLKIKDCNELVQVIGNDIEGVPNNLKLEGLPSLKEINIENCNKIKYVFGNETLEAGESSIEKEEVVLPQLKNIILKELRSLIGFCLADCNFICPLIITKTGLKVTGCPNFTDGCTVSATIGTTIGKEIASFEYDDSRQETVSLIEFLDESVSDSELIWVRGYN